jgi:hypothetical protein
MKYFGSASRPVISQSSNQQKKRKKRATKLSLLSSPNNDYFSYITTTENVISNGSKISSEAVLGPLLMDRY